MAAFVPEYWLLPGTPITAAREEVTMIEPSSFINSGACFSPKNTPKALILMLPWVEMMKKKAEMRKAPRMRKRKKTRMNRFS